MAGCAGVSAEIRHDEKRGRYSLLIAGTEAYLTYERPRPGHWHITHTIVPDTLSGQGLGRRLVERLMEDVIREEETVSSSCWFASALIERRADWQALRAE